VIVPPEAVVRREGAAWAYAQRDAEKFERIGLALDKRLNQGWFVGKGLAPGDKVVVNGAQQLLSEEQKGGGVD
jgi:multidrug efflux pump subunit AcrA (membrane-fusion protein)